MTDDMAQLNIEVPRETKEGAKAELDHGGLTRVVRNRLEEIAHGTKVTEKQRVKDRLADLRTTRKELKQERLNIDEELDQVERDIERAEERLDQLRDTESEYEGALCMIEENMEQEGMSIFPDHGQVQEAARIGDCGSQDVINDIRERNPQYGDGRYTEGI